MNLKEYFALYECKVPTKRTILRRTSFALRRSNVDTMETLCEMCKKRPKELGDMRDIGTKSLALIDEICSSYKEP